MIADIFFSRKTQQYQAMKALDRRNRLFFPPHDENATIPVPALQQPEQKRQFITIQHILKLKA